MTLSDFQPIAAIATTPAGVQTLQRLASHSSSPPPFSIWVPPSLAHLQGTSVYSGSLRDHLAQLWPTQRSLLFALATGAVVRLIAPLLTHKADDPAVVVIDEAGSSVISLCGGHQGGADGLTRGVAIALNAKPIITGASHHGHRPGIDILGRPFGWRKGSGDWTGVSATIARQEAVQVIQEAGSPLWREHLPPDHPFQFGEASDSALPSTAKEPNCCSTPKAGVSEARVCKAQVWISPMQHIVSPDVEWPSVQWHPRVLWLGVGCERGTSQKLIEQGIQQVCQAHHLAEEAIAGLATLGLKADEPALVNLCRDRQWPLRCFPAERLRSIPVPTPSSTVEQAVGTPSVAEAAAILAAHLASETWDGASHEPSPADFLSAQTLRVPKHVLRQTGEPGAATVAIAEANREYIGHTGRLWLIGTGPGQLDQMTTAAQGAIAQADAVIGYSLYVELVRPLLKPGQIVETFSITQESERAARAIALAQWGLTVAIISSGDCGIYGMAGLVLEQLRASGWDGHTPEIQIFPGVSAFQAAASRVGTPLMHDFCAISLSDLLTPWPMIENRLDAAAQADFVTALYNPKSKSRTEQIAIARQIFLKHRSPDTPVAIVRSAYREDEQVTLTTLDHLLDHPIDMMTLVLIGNQSSQRYHDWLITPRGYLGFT